MTVYGLTGKTGAGKSTVAKKLSKKGFFVIDADEIARLVVKKGSPVLKNLANEFGNDIIDDNGELNRKLLAQRAFSSPQNTDLLNKITHTAIDEAIRKIIFDASQNGKDKFIIDAAALLESPTKKLCSKIIVVTAPEKLRLERIMKRDGIFLSQAMTRINAQKDDDYYLEQADIIIRNYPPYNIDESLSEIL
ncbi:MAG: dephospho-CoA kinase [Acutalibacteraceae bacterium]